MECLQDGAIRTRSLAHRGGVRLFAAVLASASAIASGCGPIHSTSLLMDADVELSASRTADAVALAPYEYTAAEAYLHKAREEQGYADYEIAIGFAKKALQHARDAKQKALSAKADGAMPVIPPAGERESPTLSDTERGGR